MTVWDTFDDDDAPALSKLLEKRIPVPTQLTDWIGRAAVCGAADCVRVLVEKGASLTASYESGSSLLHLAMAFSGRARIVKTLLELGVDPHQTDGTGWNALQWAVEWASDEHADDDDREIVDLIRAAME